MSKLKIPENMIKRIVKEERIILNESEYPEGMGDYDKQVWDRMSDPPKKEICGGMQYNFRENICL